MRRLSLNRLEPARKSAQNIPKNRCRTTIAERIVETRAELPFIGDQVSRERLALPDPEADIWSITVDPTDCRTVYAGCGPVGVYRSEDDGDQWKKLPDPGLPDRVHMTFPCRVVCHERRMGCMRRAAVREMKEGPSSSVIRSRSQATASCCGQKPWW